MDWPIYHPSQTTRPTFCKRALTQLSILSCRNWHFSGRLNVNIPVGLHVVSALRVHLVHFSHALITRWDKLHNSIDSIEFTIFCQIAWLCTQMCSQPDISSQYQNSGYSSTSYFTIHTLVAACLSWLLSCDPVYTTNKAMWCLTWLMNNILALQKPRLWNAATKFDKKNRNRR